MSSIFGWRQRAALTRFVGGATRWAERHDLVHTGRSTRDQLRWSERQTVQGMASRALNEAVDWAEDNRVLDKPRRQVPTQSHEGAPAGSTVMRSHYGFYGSRE